MTIVIGAGMAGLLAACMLRNECTQVIEKNSQVPNNHSAVLRFRSQVVSDVINIPFKEVEVLKAVQPWRNPVADALAYSYKCNGASTLRSITSANGEVNKRYIAPPDFIQQMVERVTAPFMFDHKITTLDVADGTKGPPVISTMPMPVLMELLGWEGSYDFESVDGVNVTADIEGCDAYCSLYVPDPDFYGARISVTGDQMIVECPGISDTLLDPPDVMVANEAAMMIGVNHKRLSNIQIKHQKYAKILPVPENERKRFMLWATEKHNVYSLGRFATWRPGLLLDDVVNDVRVIHKMIHGGSAYDHKKGS